MNESAKVGAFTVGGLMAFGAATMSLGNIHFGADDNYTIYAGGKAGGGANRQGNKYRQRRRRRHGDYGNRQ